MYENNDNHDDNQAQLTRTLSCTPETKEIFQLIYDEKIEELINYISSDKNEVWDIKRGDNITLLHSVCVLDKTHIIEVIIKQTKIRLNINFNNSLSNEEKEKNKEIFINFIC